MDYRVAKKAPFIRAVSVAATGAAFANAQAAQMGAGNNPAAGNSEFQVPPSQGEGDIEIIDIFTGANPVSMYFKDTDGSIGPSGIPFPANFFYSFQITGLYSLIFVGAAASVVTAVVWRQESSEPTWAPAQLSESLQRLVNKLDTVFPGVDS